ncbi:putative iron-regulated membrane protein [Acidovorax soli]|uniref:Putative iron-regulated membrane protein n=1 Tax=Acidovorax soli TaxID=592050 RepID=A0A7X0PLP2_9BURK|nr:PepSY-associated TM helix domain-containing protein [Acidovorax soli]MBB6564101.1 putative iron-regulated membrane protein [Acidovorax soli]
MGSVARAAPGLRQTMAWLHTWCGLVCGWLLCAIFLTGTISVFREPITRWMEAAPLAEQPARPLPWQERLQAVQVGARYLEQSAPGAGTWHIQLPLTREDAVTVFARTQGGRVEARLHPQTGESVPAPARRVTEGGRHFMSFHYSLQGGIAGFWVVGLVSMGMLVALVSGVVVHRRIFQDFFTFRPGKGQRSWLDAHNATAVLALPFLFMIVYTGLAHFYASYMPWPLQALYGTAPTAYSRYQAELNAREGGPVPQAAAPGVAAPDLADLVQRAQPLLQEPVASVVVQRPAAGPATVRVAEHKPDTGTSRRMVNQADAVLFDAATGQVLQMPQRGAQPRFASEVYPVISALHLVTFGGWAMKWLYFVCGLVGTAMIATGLLLFAVKRRSRGGNEWGAATPAMYRCIDALNVAALAGAALASIAYLYGNRLLPLALQARSSWEIRVFLAVWALSLVHALLRPPRQAWREQLCAVALMCLALPLLNGLTTGQHLGLYLAHGDHQRAGLELTTLALGLLVAWVAWRHHASAAGPQRGAGARTTARRRLA